MYTVGSIGGMNKILLALILTSNVHQVFLCLHFAHSDPENILSLCFTCISPAIQSRIMSWKLTPPPPKHTTNT